MLLLTVAIKLWVTTTMFLLKERTPSLQGDQRSRSHSHKLQSLAQTPRVCCHSWPKTKLVFSPSRPPPLFPKVARKRKRGRVRTCRALPPRGIPPRGGIRRAHAGQETQRQEAKNYTLSYHSFRSRLDLGREMLRPICRAD